MHMTDSTHIFPAFFKDEQDLLQLVQFLAQIHAHDPYHCYWRPGDLLWTRYQKLTFDPQQHVRLWRNSYGDLLAFAWFAPYGTTIQVSPDVRQERLLYEDILTWVEDHWRATFAHEAGRRNLWCHAFIDDEQFVEALVTHGFQRGQECQLLLFQELATSLPEPDLPSGWSIRPLGSEQEFMRRLEIEHACWQVSQSLEDYRQMRKAPGYVPELDLAVIDAENVVVAYTTIWTASTSQCGYFEPVSVHPTAQRKGIGRMLLHEGLRRLQVYGGKYARVSPLDENEGAKKLYTSVGFVCRNQDWYWYKPMREQTQ
jgi:mycothiol synthase